ncbi:MAG: VWA domain-containing protein [Spirochaetes bacterium]|nr:VWA domain-containing protein [Spirochaetota bacterium]
MTAETKNPEFFEYWETLGFFDDLKTSLPREFFILFEIARLIASPEGSSEAMNAIEELSKKNPEQIYDRNKSIAINRLEKNAALSDKMDIKNYKTIYDLKKAVPRELFWEKQIFNIKLFTKTLLVQKYYESDADKFVQISPLKDNKGRNKARFDQKFYLLLDRSRSMENRMRSFYSKTIVVEFLRRKLEGNAKLFYRAFDSKPGSLVKIEKKEDFSSLIEKVIFTATGGTSTNMQEAIFQAIDDITYDKEMSDAEILVVTDGLVHDLNIDKMKDRLKDIRLNIFKIGLDLAEPNNYEIERLLSEAGYKFDPFSVSIKDIKKKLTAGDNGKSNPLTPVEQRIYEYMLDCSEKIIRDIKEISYRFIEIDDIKPKDIPVLNEESEKLIEQAVNSFSNIDFNNLTIEELSVLYKKAYFLSQYIEFLLKSAKGRNNPILLKAAKDLALIKQEMLSDPGLFKMIMKTKGFEDDKKLLKSAKKKAKAKSKEMMLENRTLSKEEIKNAQLIFSTGSVGESGNIGQFLRVLFIKFWEMIRTIIKKIFRPGNTV